MTKEEYKLYRKAYMKAYREKNKGTYMRGCPKCNSVLYYTLKESLSHANKIQSVCNFCSKTLTNYPRRHNPLTQKVKNKMSISQKDRCFNLNVKIILSNGQKKRYSSPQERKQHSERIRNAWKNPKIREIYYNSLLKSGFLRRRFDVGQLELLNKWNKLGFNFEPNYQIHTDCDLFYVDGYDKEKNVVIEYDSKYHSRPSQKQKDLIRQQKIISILKPNKFWRYNVIDKQCKNVLEN
jgi:hypothetical protein